jgi:nucleoside-diphosphate-sugar epimerase
MPPKALITGATGFIGSHLVETLVKKEWDVTCYIRPRSRTDFLRKFPIRLIKGHVDDQPQLEKALAGQDYVFHLAARIRSARPEVYDKANHQYTKNLAQACLKTNPSVSRLLYVSSISAAGPSLPGQYSDEKKTDSPTSEYGRSKLKGEHAVIDLKNRLPFTIIRPPNVYGPRQQETELLVNLIRRKIVPVLKERGEITSLIYITDLIEGIIKAACSQKTIDQTYYLTDSHGYSWRNIILTIKKYILGSSLYLPLYEHIILLTAWIFDLLKTFRIFKSYFGRRAWITMTRTPWLFSPEKAKKDFCFKAEYTLERGIKETVEYYRNL